MHRLFIAVSLLLSSSFGCSNESVEVAGARSAEQSYRATQGIPSLVSGVEADTGVCQCAGCCPRKPLA
jgi:hypothetical protein